MGKIILLLSLFAGNFAMAQVNEKELHDQEFKLAALPYYNYGKGLGVTSADSLFQLNIRFRMQNRVTYNDSEDLGSSYEAHIRRLRLRFDGYVGNPKFQYVVQSEEHTSELQSRPHLVCRLLLEKKKI